MSFEGISNGWGLSGLCVQAGWVRDDTRTGRHSSPRTYTSYHESRSNRDGWNGQRELVYNQGLHSIFAELGGLVTLPCFIVNMERNERHCFLFYVYGWFFGLGLGIIAATYCLVENETVPSQVNMIGAVAVSLIVLVSQVALNTCARNHMTKHSRNRANSIIRFVGLPIIMLATLAGTFSSENPGGLFFICAIFSFSCYLMAFMGFLVRWCRDLKKNRQRALDRENDDQVVANAGVQTYPVWVPDISMVFHHGDEFVQIDPGNSSQIIFPPLFNADGEPLPILTLPTYSEAVSQTNDANAMQPPEYSDTNPDRSANLNLTIPDTQSYTIREYAENQEESSTDPHIQESISDTERPSRLEDNEVHVVQETNEPPRYQISETNDSDPQLQNLEDCIQSTDPPPRYQDDRIPDADLPPRYQAHSIHDSEDPPPYQDDNDTPSDTSDLPPRYGDDGDTISDSDLPPRYEDDTELFFFSLKTVSPF